nr:MAG TPA: hypothetical protein [Caudoviricetes sp.]
MRNIFSYINRIRRMPSPLKTVGLFPFTLTTILNSYSSSSIVSTKSRSLCSINKSSNEISF